MQTTDGDPTRGRWSVRELIGLKLRSRRDEDLGKIVDLVVQAPEMRLTHALVSLGGLWGFGEKVFAVPVSALQYSGREQAVYLNIEKDVFDRATEADLEQWAQGGSAAAVDQGDQIFALGKTEAFWRSTR